MHYKQEFKNILILNILHVFMFDTIVLEYEVVSLSTAICNLMA